MSLIHNVRKFKIEKRLKEMILLDQVMKHL